MYDRNQMPKFETPILKIDAVLASSVQGPCATDMAPNLEIDIFGWIQQTIVIEYIFTDRYLESTTNEDLKNKI